MQKTKWNTKSINNNQKHFLELQNTAIEMETKRVVQSTV